MIIGHLDRFSSGNIFGWIGSFTGEVLPFITANGKPCQIRLGNLSRPDVATATGLPENSGFIADVPHIESTQIEFKLYAITSTGVRLVDNKIFYGASINPKRFCSIFDALDIARKENAVAITCRQASDNEIFRAYALYKTVAHQRPAVIIAFDMEMPDSDVWRPLKNSDAKLLIIPWRDRALYFSLFKEIGLSFNTIWICNPSYHAYELTRHIANQNTRFIQDVDNNESYDFYKKNHDHSIADLMGRKFFKKFKSLSLSSPILTETIEGKIIFYAQPYAPSLRERNTDPSHEIKVGYFGIAAQEKGLAEAAKVINYLQKSQNLNVKLIVNCTEIEPHFQAQLEALHCDVNNNLDFNDLNLHAQNVDVLICGFPIDVRPMVSDFSTSAKIACALSNNRPILVPESHLEFEHKFAHGVYLFNQETFLEKLTLAVSDITPIVLPEELTPEFNYQKFIELETQASQTNLNFKDLFGYMYDPIESNKITGEHQKTNVVLVWKQHDTGLYGRRVDQIARSLVANRFWDNILSVEIMTRDQLDHYKENSKKIESDTQYIYTDFFEKKSGVYRDGVFFHTLFLYETENFSSTMNKFLIEKRLFPTNTIFILFPAITELYQLLASIDGYKTISDIVDNQITWETGTPLPLLNQYLTLNHFSQKIIFNSEENMKYFTGNNIFLEEKSLLVPNWYRTPATYTLEAAESTEKPFLDLLYSGNMNDRIDWSLLKSLHDRTPKNVRIHLVGSADNAINELVDILEKQNKFIYHGPMREHDLLRLASTCDLALLPHTIDKHSTYMNPMKINMYCSIGLRCISTDVPGIDKNTPNLIVCQTQEDFITQTIDLLKIPTPAKANLSAPHNREATYIDIIDDLFSLQ